MINRDKLVYRVEKSKLIYTIDGMDFEFDNSSEADNWLDTTTSQDIKFLLEGNDDE
mgnify:CR=1 FL=1